MELRCQYSMHKTSIVSNVIKKARSEEIDEFKQKKYAYFTTLAITIKNLNCLWANKKIHCNIFYIQIVKHT